jgi:hypothetical protein
MPLTLNGTTGIAGANGSASTPAVQGEDTNTGVFFPAADTVAVATGGTERMRVASTGFVGIGTSSPSEELHVYSADNAIILVETAAGTDSRLRLLTANDRIGYIEFGDTDDVDTGEIRYEHSSNAMIFATNGNVDRMRIDSSGNLLVGTTSQINGHTFKSSEGVATYRPTGTAGNGIHHFYSDFGSTQSLRAYLTANGGLSNFSANNVNLSDERVKTDIFPVGSYWDKVKALQVVTYKYRDQGGGEDNIGVIAQQVESVAPEFVCTSGFGETPADGVPLKSIYETDLHYAALKALQEAMTRIEALEVEVAALKEAAQ